MAIKKRCHSKFCQRGYNVKSYVLPTLGYNIASGLIKPLQNQLSIRRLKTTNLFIYRPLFIYFVLGYTFIFDLYRPQWHLLRLKWCPNYHRWCPRHHRWSRRRRHPPHLGLCPVHAVEGVRGESFSFPFSEEKTHVKLKYHLLFIISLTDLGSY